MKRFFAPLIFTIIFSFTAMAQEEKPMASTIDKVKVFPNPATTVVNVLGLQNSDRAEITVTDTYGNTMLKHRWQIKNKALNIPVSSLSSGIYIITISSAEQRVRTKFYKQ